jgi:tetratricopeptide (TPR) repeat protein
MRTRTVYLGALVLMASLLLTRCNVFEGFSEPGKSNDPETLLEDALLALQSGKTEAAIEYLEKALANAPPGHRLRPRVQVALSNALLRKAQVNVLTLERLARDFNHRVEGQRAAKQRTSLQEACSFPETHIVQQEITLDDLDGYVELSSWEEALRRVEEITREVLGTTTLPFDIQGRIATLRSQGVSDEEIAAALLNAAIASVGTSFIALVQVGMQRQVRWYSVRRPGGSAYLGYCAADEATVAQVRQRLACSVDAVGFAAALLQARVALLNNSQLARELGQRVQEAYEALEENLGGECTTID